MYLQANQVSGIIFVTATHLGTSAAGTPDDVYGWGLVNLAKALQPVGDVTVATYGSTGYALGSSAITTNSLLKSAAFNGLSLTATDDFGRAYSYAVGSFVIKPEISSIDTLFTSMDKQMSMVESISSNSSLSLSMYKAPGEMQKLGNPFAMPVGENPILYGFSFMQKFGCQQQACQGEYAFGANGFADQYFGLSAEYKNLPLTNSFANPYFQFAGTASHIAMGYNLGENYKLKMGFLNAANPLGSQPAMASSAGSNGWISEVEKRFEGGAIRASVGNINENQSMLGATGTAAFGMDGARTHFISLSGAYALSTRTSLLAQTSIGGTKTVGSAIIQASEAKTQSWSLGLLQQDVRKKGDKLAFSIAQPMKVTSGAMNLALPTVDPVSGQGGFDFTQVNMASGHTETDFEAGYMTPVSKASALRFIAAYKMNLNNDSGNARVLGMRYQTRF